MGDLPPFVAFVVVILFAAVVLLTLRVAQIVIHELGHALAAVAMGLPPREFSIGSGRIRASVEIGGVRFSLRRLRSAVGGYVLFRPKTVFAFRFRHSVILMAGVGAEIAIWLAVFGQTFPSVPASIESQDGEIVFRTIALFSLILVAVSAVLNLLPMTFRGVPNDGLRLLTVLSRTNSVEREHLRHQQAYTIHEAGLAQERGELEPVLASFDAKLAASSSPDPVGQGAPLLERWQIQQVRAYSLIQLMRYDEAVEASGEAWHGVKDAAERDGELHQQEIAVGGTHAYALALAGRGLDLALGLAEADVARDPSAPIEHTLGAVLVQGQDPARGVRILTAALSATPTDVDRMETHRFLAIGQWRLGDLEAAEDHVRRAVEACPGAISERLQELPEPLRPS